MPSKIVYSAAPPGPPPRAELIAPPISNGSSGARTDPPTAEFASKPRRGFTAAAVVTPFGRHMMNRMAWGLSDDTSRQMHEAGGPRRWFEQQLHPERVPDPLGARFDAWYGDRMLTADAKWGTVFAETKYQWNYAEDLANWSLLRRSRSSRQLQEVMTDLWSNHFHVPSVHDLAWCWRNQYDAMLRRGALGRFDELLISATLHPSMLLYLSNFESSKQAPNENHGRELLELHTVGVGAGYTEAMIKDSARILTGYTVNVWQDWKARYDSSWHATGSVSVLGFTHANAAPDGREMTKAYLRYLAHHPATARRVATKLAVRFVSDDPSPELINHLANRYLAAETDISATLRALVKHPEFAASQGTKVRNPIEDFVATVRTLGVEAQQPTADGWPFASAQIWMCQGQYPFMWPRPDGLPQTNPAWCSASQVLGALDVHYSMAGGWIGDAGSVLYRAPVTWLPQDSLRFDAFVDHLSRTLLGRASTPLLLKAAREATGCRDDETVDRGHALVQWLMPRLLTTILDTPAHMSR